MQWGVPPWVEPWAPAGCSEQGAGGSFILGAFSSIFQFAPCPLTLGTALAWLKLHIFKL